MKFKPLLFLSLIAAAVISCSAEVDKMDTGKLTSVRRFIDYVKNNEGDKAFVMLNHGVYNEGDRPTVKMDVQTFHEFYKKYGMPPERSWKVSYDTANPFIKTVNISVPFVNEANGDDFYSQAALILKFDYTRAYLPDSILAGYEFEAKYQPLKKR
ncbi:hypothetical protein [Polluticoccus soli]|uniref:hypothetical protein n=1 Tax=Polluticoccus soli TaxID=3034150 RepID=UPI0023E0FECE|nr:hypothetical protein [Flavipsychrobacter sp. JY13-12]